MNTTTLSLLANKILKTISEKTAFEDFQAINKNMFSGESVENFFAALEELKKANAVVFYQDYVYKAYSGFGDTTPKQYGNMQILVKINKDFSRA